ncbi:MAG TPA: glucose-6-phosphate dehydrogenase assembly protein OpcA [Xanthomonadales bacterium]|nr:glucose-6-phosphate dehydrogenase assembly protein OpcA [Xanthomonadales bacterium]
MSAAEPAAPKTSLEEIRAELARTKLTASTMNFLVWIDDPARRDWILERAALLSEKHPSLTIVLDHTGACEHGEITTGERDEHVDFTVQGERVQLDVSCLNAETILGYVAALVKTSVPTILWWSGLNEDSAPIFYALLPLANTLLFDSSGGVADESTVRRLAEFHAKHPHVVLRDLAWLRLRPWQDMIANFFDDPDVTDDVFTIRRFHVRSGSDAEAFYLGGWLASRLGWKASGRDAFTDLAGAAVRFERVREGEVRRVHGICLDSETSWYHAEVTEDATVVRMWVEGEHAREPRLFPLAAMDNASLLERAILEGVNADEVYETALKSVATLLG